MQSDIDDMNRHYEKLAGYVDQYVGQAVVEWARLVVNHPKALLLVMETTRVVDENGTDGDSEPIRLTALPLKAGGNIWDQLLCPAYETLSSNTGSSAKLMNQRKHCLLVDNWRAIEYA
jgi:hypothetical protein